jgi:hypothetical protein
MQKRMGFVIFSICFLVLFSNFNLGHANIKKDVDLISLHYDHAKDPDDCHSAAADRTIIQSEFGLDWMKKNVVAVSGACGVENCDTFVPGTDAVMDAVFNGVAGWVPAYTEDGYAQWDAAVDTLTDRWCETLQAGGDVWVKEGGQSDFTADVLAAVRSQLPNIDTAKKVHVVQHGSAANSDDTSLNEIWADQAKLAFVKANTDYIGVRNGNEYLHWPYGEYGAEKAAFGAAALAHPVFGPSWEAAFALMSYTVRVDFSDTAMLMNILGLGEMNIANFKNRYLDDDISYEAALVENSGASAATYKTVNGEVVIEAENYSRLAGSTGGEWSESKEKSGFTGSAYMSASSKDPGTLTYSSNTARMEYNIDFQETGTYFLHLRTYATSHDDNGFFATIDGRSFSYGHTQAYYVCVPWMNKWWWYADGGGAEGRGYKISINITTTGLQKLAIIRRDKGTCVDRIWLTKKVSTSPKATNYTLPDPSKFMSSSSDTSGDSSDSSDGASDTPGDSSDSSTTAGSGITFVQAMDDNGLVQLDAFDFSAKASRSNHSWARSPPRRRCHGSDTRLGRPYRQRLCFQ